MPAPKSKPSSSGSSDAKPHGTSTPASASQSQPGALAQDDAGGTGDPAGDETAGAGVQAGGTGDQIANRIFRPLDLVMLTRERIQDTLDEFAERGRVTRDDANDLVAELVRRGREQTDDILGDIEQLLDRGRDQLEVATKKARRVEPVDRIVRTADRARRTVGVGPSFPILGYDDLTAAQVEDRLGGLTPPELRKVRDYERRHGNRKTVLAAIEKALP
jgi:polyhydroxyalkanoate synthesis regulator phasin